MHPPFSRTSSFYDSCIPFTIRLWNTLPLTITESPSLNIFKNRLTHFYKTRDTNAFYNFGIRKFNIIHCQLIKEVSKPKAHLFNDFVSDNTDCPNCIGLLEESNHFLFICPEYNNLRLVLLDSIQTIIPKHSNVDINIDLLLHVNRSFSYDLNTEIIKAVHKYISDTHRFI